MNAQYSFFWSWMLLCCFLFSPRESNAQWPQASILLNNFDPDAPIYFWSGSGPILKAPADTYVQILARPPASATPFKPVGDFFGKTIFSIDPIFPGFFDAGLSTNVPGVGPNEMGEFYVRAWRGANTWEEALQNPNAFVGQSEVFQDRTGNIGIGNVGGLEAHATALSHLRSFTILPVPEPSTLAMGFWGALLFWPIIRKKRKHR